MSVLVIGANGLVGSSIVRQAQQNGFSVLGTYHKHSPKFDIPLYQLDLQNEDRIKKIIQEISPDTVVNCAALTDVDRCEKEKEQARIINEKAPGHIAAVCAELNIRFVHFSTDYVFDGSRNTRYAEEHEPNPVQTYGETKLRGEELTLDVNPDALVCRLSFVYGRHGETNELEGLPAWITNRAQAGQNIPLFTDQYVTPTRAGFAAETIFSLLEADQNGIFHLASSDCITPYTFGKAIVERLSYISIEKIDRSSMTKVSRVADRPSRTCLSTKKIESVLGKEPPRIESDLDVLFS